MRIKRLILSLLLLGCGFFVSGRELQSASPVEVVAGLRQILPAEGPDTLERSRACREFDLKTNLIYDATASVSLGVEFPLGRRWSFDFSGSYNGWTFDNQRKWKHWMVQPEFRFWTKTRQRGHFLGVHLLGGEYNLNRMHLPFEAWPSTSAQRHEGWGGGAGLTYGYRWNFSERWGMEGQIGVGYIYTEYDTYCPNDCGVRIGSDTYHYFGPTKIALNLIYRFGKKKRAAEAARLAALRAPQPVVTERIVRDTVYIRDTVTIDASLRPQRFRSETYTLHLQYEVGSAKILRHLADNQERLVAFKEFIDRIKGDSSVVVQRISLTGYCSIEGTAMHNDRLSYARAQSLREYLLGFYPWMEEVMHIDGRGEDWAGLLRLVEQSSIPTWKNDIEHIILNTGIYEGRERKLMELYGGYPYRWMAEEFFPELRRIECNVEYTIREQ
ncbi:MAG: DUF3575 domain-containing protein [Alistipes sp.]|nr:DUF3575 domain-containing protein [Alistipes sp.]